MDLSDTNLRLNTRSVVYKPDIGKGIKCYAYADFSGGWAQSNADNAENVMLRTGYVITYAGCPILWCSKLQRDNALSTIEVGYIALRQTMRNVIHFVTLINEI